MTPAKLPLVSSWLAPISGDILWMLMWIKEQTVRITSLWGSNNSRWELINSAPESKLSSSGRTRWRTRKTSLRWILPSLAPAKELSQIREDAKSVEVSQWVTANKPREQDLSLRPRIWWRRSYRNAMRVQGVVDSWSIIWLVLKAIIAMVVAVQTNS